MGKRAGHQASRERDYIPFGRPATVTIVRVEAQKAPDGSAIEARYEERFNGFSSDGTESARTEPHRGDFHAGHCKGRTGVARVWERAERTWCHGCYVMRFGEEPPADVTIKVRKRPRSTRPLGDTDRALRGKFF